MEALKLLWIFTIGVSIFVGTALVVCLAVTLIQSNQAKPRGGTVNSPISRTVAPVNCFWLIRGDESEQRRTAQYQTNHPRIGISNEEYINMAKHCAKFVETRGYVTFAVSEEEKDIPLAFDIRVSRDVELFERLLRTVYRPQNFYCVHVDRNAESTVRSAVNKITGCFENVFLIQNNTAEDTWGAHLVEEPDVLCMDALLKYTNWMYFISLTGEDFPLRTNLELVKILKTFRGASIIGAKIKLPAPDRLVGALPPRIDVGSLRAPVHIVAKRHLVEFIVNDEKARKTSNWTQPARLPSRFYFSPLNSGNQTGGGDAGSQVGDRQFIDRYKIWQTSLLPCRGNYSQGFCTYGIGDLPMLAASPHFFASRFDLNFDPLALDCLEELVFNRTQDEMLGLSDFNTCYYECLLH